MQKDKKKLIKNLLGESAMAISASNKLYNFQPNPFHFWAAGFLGHLGVELIIKACFRYEKNEKAPNIHEILTLIESISFLNLTENIEFMTILERIDELYYLRYGDNKITKNGEREKRIDELTKSGILPSPFPIWPELGHTDWDIIVKCIVMIATYMPQELFDIFKSEFIEHQLVDFNKI